MRLRPHRPKAGGRPQSGRRARREGEPSLDTRQLGEAHVSDLGAPESEVATPEGPITVLRIEFAEQLCGASIGREELDDRERIDLIAGSGSLAICEQLTALCFCKEFHRKAPFGCGSRPRLGPQPKGVWNDDAKHRGHRDLMPPVLWIFPVRASLLARTVIAKRLDAASRD